jgi:hypothetical protein
MKVALTTMTTTTITTTWRSGLAFGAPKRGTPVDLGLVSLTSTTKMTLFWLPLVVTLLLLLLLGLIMPLVLHLGLPSLKMMTKRACSRVARAPGAFPVLVLLLLLLRR